MPRTTDADAALDYDRTLVLAIELSNKSWVLAAQVPGLPHAKAKRTIVPTAEALMAAIDGYRARAAAAGRTVERMIAVYEAGWSGFWLARWLACRGVETHVIQPSSVPVDRRARRAKSDGIDAELLLRTLLAWLRGEPRVCSMVPIPSEADEDARRAVRERRSSSPSGSALATASVRCWPRWACTATTRSAETDAFASRVAHGARRPVARNARAKIARMLDRLELLLAQIADLDRQRDAVLEEEAPDKASEMIQQLTKLRGIGVQSATVLVREAFVRGFASGKALWTSGPPRPTTGRHAQGRWARQGRKPPAQDHDDRVGLALAALSARLACRSACRERAGATGPDGKVMVVALARKLLIRCGGSSPRAWCQTARP